MLDAGTDELIFHVCRREEWELAAAAGIYHGSSQDRADGFIHFSSGAQVRASVAKHRAGQVDLVILSVDPGRLDADALKWEPSRGGALFPHLYRPLPTDAVVRVDRLMLREDGTHRFPDNIGTTVEGGS